MAFSSAKIICWPNFIAKYKSFIHLMCFMIICHSFSLTLKAVKKESEKKLIYNFVVVILRQSLL